MIKATKIRMHSGKEQSNAVTEIESIYLTGTGIKNDGFYTKESIHDFIKNNPNSNVYVDISPNPKLIAATKGNQKYVRSAPNETPDDNLLKLPRVWWT